VPPLSAAPGAGEKSVEMWKQIQSHFDILSTTLS